MVRIVSCRSYTIRPTLITSGKRPICAQTTHRVPFARTRQGWERLTRIHKCGPRKRKEGMDNSYWGYAQIGAPAYMHPAAMPTDGRYPHLVRNLPSIVQPGIYPDQGQMGQHGPGHRPQYARGVPLQPILPYPTPGPMGPNAAGRPPVPVPGMLFSTPQPVPILPRTYPFQEQAVHGLSLIHI